MLAMISAALATTPAAVCPLVAVGEMEDMRAWVGAKFRGVTTAVRPRPGLYVIANNDPVQKNGRMGRPMVISGRAFTRGLYCHAVSRIVVRLPAEGKTFTALCGVDSNEQTSGGRGSVIFSVTVGDRTPFRTGVVREGMHPVSARAELGGLAEFVLDIGDGGDGISCDQADWADASVEMADGTTIRLGDLPLFGGGPPQAYDTDPPFSFVYGGRSSRELLPRWQSTRSERALAGGRIEHTVTWTDPDTRLGVRCIGVEYGDYPTVEWTLYLRNNADRDTPLIADVMALDARIQRTGMSCVLNHNTGSPCIATDYRPLRTALTAGSDVRIATNGGRPTNSDLPYFNLEWADSGVIAALGWPGQWAATFTASSEGSVHVRGGQELTHFVLHRGEEVRAPLAVLQFWYGDRTRSHNVWRRWMLAHNVPRPEGKAFAPQFAACSSHQFGEMIHADDASQKLFVDRYLEEGIKLDYWWMDAGWYVNNGGWPNTGTWEVDTRRFPGGLRSITDHAHSRGVGSIVWFEPERVNPGTWLYDQRPQWLLGSGGGDRLLNLGDPEARQWWVDHASRTISEQGIDFYRTDFNIDPLPFWRANDAPDRQGITEIRYVTGFLEYLDELHRRHPGLRIDTCASGGRRNDLETLRRAVPLLRSDYILDPVAQQLHTYGISSWIPFHGTGANATDAYTFRSQACPNVIGCWDVRRKDVDYASLRMLYKEWREVAPLMLADFYPLTAYSTEQDVWMAWQYNRPEDGTGMVQAFRRAGSIYESARLRLRGLDEEARYRVVVAGKKGGTIMSGRALMEDGLRIDVPTRPGSEVVRYASVSARR